MAARGSHLSAFVMQSTAKKLRNVKVRIGASQRIMFAHCLVG